MKTAIDALAETIDAVGSADFYRAFAAYLRLCLKYDNVIVIAFQGSAAPTVIYKKIYGPDVFRHVEQQYLPGAYLLDPVYHMHMNRSGPGLYRLLEIAPDNFRRSRYYKWYYGRIGITDEISVVLPIGRDTTITVSMGRDSSSGQMFSARAEEELRAHEPTIMAVLRAHWRAHKRPAPERGQTYSIIEGLRTAMRSQRHVALTPRQTEVALLILQGHSTPSIGLHLGISAHTVKVFRKQLYLKCGISSQAELFSLMMPLLETQTRENSAVVTG